MAVVRKKRASSSPFEYLPVTEKPTKVQGVTLFSAARSGVHTKSGQSLQVGTSATQGHGASSQVL